MKRPQPSSSPPSAPDSPPNSQPRFRLITNEHPPTTLEAIYRRYCRYVAAVVLRLDGRSTEVDDLVQDVFVEAAAGLARLREPEAIKGWLATIAVRTVRRRLRLRRIGRFLGLVSDIDEVGAIDGSASPLDRLLLRAVYRVLDETPTEERLAYCLHRLEGETIESVASLCQCSVATAKRRVSRAQRRIEGRLADG